MASGAPQGRTAGRVVCALGLALLAIGFGVAGIERQTPADRLAARNHERVTRLEAQLRRDDRRVPRVEVTFAKFALSDLPRLAAAGPSPGQSYVEVPTVVGRRIATRRPPLRPAYAKLRHDRRLAGWARAFRAKQTRNGTMSVLALLVTTTAPASPVQLRLVVDRAEIDGYADIYDPIDLVSITDPSDLKTITRTTADLLAFSNVRSRKAEVRWTADAAHRSALVPLAVVDDQVIPRTPANEAFINAVGGFARLSPVSDVALLPRRLFLGRAGRRELKVSIANAIGQPVVLSAG